MNSSLLNPESVILNHALNLFHGLVQNLFRAGLFSLLREERIVKNNDTLSLKAVDLVNEVIKM